MLSIWSADGKTRSVSIYSNSNQHHAGISLIAWNSTGKRLISGDKARITTSYSSFLDCSN
jgi:hypothetical protein